jgi:RimJ/RimL family protein N-acetyltransferase
LVEAFALVYYKKSEIIAKIKEDNLSSQKLFESCGYTFLQYE